MRTHEPGLPSEKVRDSILLKACPLQLVAGTGGVVACRHVAPVGDILTPVVQKPGLVESIGCSELVLEAINERIEDLGVGGAVGCRLVIDLPANHGWFMLVVLDEVADESLSVATVIRVVRVHVLPHAIANRSSAKRACEDFGMSLPHPHRDRVGGGAHESP